MNTDEEPSPRLEDLGLADGEIVSFCCIHDKMTVWVRDWQEKAWTIEFREVFAVEALACYGQDLVDVRTTDDNDLLRRTRERFGNDAESSRAVCYGFYEAWEDEPILQVVTGSALTIREGHVSLPAD